MATKEMLVINRTNQPRRMLAAIQHYAWGLTDPRCWVGLFAGQTVSDRFAEAWYGDHRNGPSKVAGPGDSWIPLPELIAAQADQILGYRTIGLFGRAMPFLGKILSVGDPLSIQVHPKKAHAERLFKGQAGAALLYPDPNQKDEASVALTDVELLYGFRPADSIYDDVVQVEELRTTLDAAFGLSLDGLTRTRATDDPSGFLFDVTAMLLTADEAVMSEACRRLYSRLAGKEASLRTPAETWIVRLKDMYPDGDVGVFFFYLLNLVVIRPGQALAIPAGTPHAYLSGEMLEAMVPSDMVIRCGLTPKFRDSNEIMACTTFEVTDPRNAVQNGIVGTNGFTEYDFKNGRFTVSTANEPSILTIGDTGSPEVFLSLDGSGLLQYGTTAGQSAAYTPATAFLLPAVRDEIKVRHSGGRIARFHLPADAFAA